MNTSGRKSIPTVHDLDLSEKIDLSVPDLYDLRDLYDLAHAAAWEPYNLHDREQVLRVGVYTIFFVETRALHSIS